MPQREVFDSPSPAFAGLGRSVGLGPLVEWLAGRQRLDGQGCWGAFPLGCLEVVGGQELLGRKHRPRQTLRPTLVCSWILLPEICLRVALARLLHTTRAIAEIKPSAEAPGQGMSERG